MTRKEQALMKIRKLEGQLDTASTRAGSKIEKEICRLQLIHNITLDEIKGPKDLDKMFPFLSKSVIKAMKEAK